MSTSVSPPPFTATPGPASPAPSLYAWYILGLVVIVVCDLLGIPGNVAVMVKIVRRRRQFNMTGRLFLSLAVSDFLTLLCPPIAVVLVLGRHITDAFCQFYFFFFYFCYITGYNIVLLMSIQRYYQVLHPQTWARLGKRGEQGLLVGIWLFGAVTSLPSVFLLRAKKDDTTDTSICVVHDDYHRLAIVIEVVYIVLMILSYPLLLTFYLKLIRGVKRSAFFTKSRMTKLIIRVNAVFLVCSVPPLVVRIVLVSAQLTGSHHIIQYTGMLSLFFCCYIINSGLNPFLYFFASRSERAEEDTQKSTEMTPPSAECNLA